MITRILGSRRAAALGGLVLLGSLAVFAYMPAHSVFSAPSTTQIYWGAYISGSTYGYPNPPWDTRAIDAFEAHAGKHISIMHWGQSWYDGSAYQAFEPRTFDIVRGRGEIPMLNWNSWQPSAGINQPMFALSTIIAGNHDAYIRAWAAAARNWGHPFFLRFDDEMNGTWYPWSERANGNQAGQFVQAWRHVHDIFTQVGATNVTWVWCPNDDYDGSIPLEGLYPGDSYVDWVAVDTYNWGTNPAKPGNIWQTFAQIFGPTYNHLGQIAPSKPVMVAETASTEFGGSKAAWITDLLTTQLPVAFPRVKAVVCFNWNADGLDWVIETSSSAQAAFAAGISSPYYAANDFANLNISPIPPADALGGPTPTATPVPPTSRPVPPTSTPPPVVNLVGRVTWQGRPAPPNPLNQLPLTLTLKLGSTITSYPNLTADASGFFTASVRALPSGVYTWWVKGPQYLASTGQVALSGAPAQQQEMGLQRAGDVNNDNAIDISDFSLARASFGRACGDAGFDGRADLTGDCLVDIADFSLVRSNFGLAGPPPLSAP